MRADVNSQVILLVGDEPEVRTYIEMALCCEGYSVETAKDGKEGLNSLQMGLSVSAVLLDIATPNQDGLEVLREIRNIERNLPVIAISDKSSSGVIVEAMRAGATDFLGKPVSHESLRRVLTNIFGDSAPEAPKADPVHSSAELFFGSSPSMQALRNVVPLVAFSEAPILIQGETGVGKEVLARYVHSLSRRARTPFIKLNCAALPSELVESELFGYERGAFTGAYQRKPGMFEIADGGTLLLDEIGDMDFKLQAKLLQVLQDHEFQRLGGKEIVRVDVRIIAATHSDLEKAIAAGTFRQDLYYRLNVVSLYVPPLRELRDDIIPFADFLVKRYCTDPTWKPEITLELRRAFLTHDWPGNVRELDNVVRKFAVLRDPAVIVCDLKTRATRKTFECTQASGKIPALPAAAEAPPILDQVTQSKNRTETEAIIAALNTTHWNRKKASALLRIDYKALLYKMKKLRIDANTPGENGRVRATDEEGFAQMRAPVCPTCKNALPASLVLARAD